MVEVLTLRKTARGASIDTSLVEAVESLPNGTYQIYIAEAGYAMEVTQRKLFWMWMKYLEQWSGATKIEWHDYYVRKFLMPEKDGIRSLSTLAMSHFMNQVEADALTEFGVFLPLPKDREAYNQFVLEFRFR